MSVPVEVSPRYKWLALSNTTIGVLLATIAATIMLIAMPDIFRGIKLNPLEPGNSFYLLWMLRSRNSNTEFQCRHVSSPSACAQTRS